MNTQGCSRANPAPEAEPFHLPHPHTGTLWDCSWPNPTKILSSIPVLVWGSASAASPSTASPSPPEPPSVPSPAYAIFLPASARHRVLSWLTQATREPLAEKQMLCTHPQLLLDSNISSPKGILEPQGVGLGRSSTSLM